jgi:hypothetical protein
MVGPLGRRAQHGGNQPGLGNRRFKALGLPLPQRGGDGVAVIGHAQELEDAVAMVRKVGMQANLAAIARVIDAGDFVPGRPGRLIVEAHIALAAELDRGMAHIDVQRLPATAALAPELGGGEPGGRDGGLRNGADAKRRRQRRLATGQDHILQGLRAAAGVPPQLGQNVHRLSRPYRLASPQR